MARVVTESMCYMEPDRRDNLLAYVILVRSNSTYKLILFIYTYKLT